MNFRRIISLLLVFVMISVTFASCDLQEIISSLMGTTTTTTPTTSTTKPTTSTTKPTTSTTDKGDDTTPPDEKDWDELYDIISIEEAVEIALAAGETPTTEQYYIRGTVTTISNPQYGAMVITDGTNELSVYNTKGEGDVYFPDLEERPAKDDEVLLLCTLHTYGDKAEVKQAYLIDFKKAPAPNDSEYTEMTVAEAREAELGALVKVTGVVARITYANGMKPAGVYLVDGTNSIYVYDGDIAGQVEIGNEITVLGSKDMWILDSETNNAQKFGYKGCCQISDASLYTNDNAENEIDFEWCEEKSVKDIIETPVTENVTTTIYKTTALVKKVPGSGFTNYYFFDLDGETGAYTYTQCNGSDFAWLDEFDGKICTVYLSPMNAKSTATDCFFRFLPVAVYDEGFVYDVTKAPQHVVEYYGVGQFLSEYTGNPLTVLKTSVSSELLGFENVVLSYKSNNESVVYFTTDEDGAVVLNCKGKGTANVTITATHNGNSYSETVSITVSASEEVEADKVIDAIEAENNTTVTVIGIVGPSLVNQTGFYLIDETGAIAVRVTASAFDGLEIGQKIVVTGTRSITKDGGGQICIDNAEIVANYYGKVDYSTESFISGKTLAELVTTPDSPEATTPIYVTKATVEVVETAYYTNIKITDGSASLTLYSSSANQYSWLKQFAGQEVTIELNLCDWNAKGLKGCVLSVITENGKVYNELNFTTGK